ncbi:Highly ABA-induced PP2C protein 2 isoform 2 [Hibiscus syriacus]|uniref:protein-serine/threonine phosphatase n=1 Tax=Hibiscus syriacus TaxID=106335 RepID=A0A6A3D0R6_HIBSY|nr:Highly ABA-induced PP2C protein 2 isoform 2 [Hibiscus syriacus]
MPDICCGIMSEGKASAPPCAPISRQARRRRMAFRRFKFVGFAPENSQKRHKIQACVAAYALDRENDGGNSSGSDVEKKNEKLVKSHTSSSLLMPAIAIDSVSYPKFGFASICGRRRYMEDAVVVHPSFHCEGQDSAAVGFHYFGVYDGHGCSHLEREDEEWKGAMERSFRRMDREVIKLNERMKAEGANAGASYILGVRCRWI